MNNPWQHFSRGFNHSPLPVMAQQRDWLIKCLRLNQDCAYGKRYNFADIRQVEDFQNAVPIVDYEILRPWIDQMAEGKIDQLFSGDTLAFETTGGSHSGGKLIPYSSAGLNDFRYALLNWLAQLMSQFELAQGTAYWALSPAAAKPRTTAGGVAIGGGDAIYLGSDNLMAFAQMSAVPLSLGQVADIDDWQLLTLYYLICSPDLRLISIWSPSFLLQLLEGLQVKKKALLTLLTQGGDIAGHLLAANSTAALNYKRFLASGKTEYLWPELKVISCWADASSKPLSVQLMHHFPSVYLQPKGLLSTEAVITTPNQQNQQQLCIGSNFYEFMDGNGEIYLADALTIGNSYQVIVTTNSGLYRYNTADMVQCTGYQNDIPILSFIGRSGVISDLVGEKLTEPFVNQCLSEISGFAMLCPDYQAMGYVLLLDNIDCREIKPLVTLIERRLCNNPQYAYARQLSQLSPLTGQLVESPVSRYLSWQYAQGKRLGDVKVPGLLTYGDYQKIFK